MKTAISIITVMALVCFTTMVFAVDAAKPPVAMPSIATPAAAVEAAKSKMADEAVKAVSGQTVIGTIQKIDVAAKTIVVKDNTINVKADMIGDLKKGEKVKVTLAAGTMDAEKILVLEKKTVKKAAKKVKEKAIEKATEKAIEKIGQ